MTKCPRLPYPGHAYRGIMGKKVERGPQEIFLHLLAGRDEIINESAQNHQPPPPDKNERSLSIYRVMYKSYSLI
jgi:hypothetical protein